MSIFAPPENTYATGEGRSPFVVPAEQRSAGRAWLLSLLLPGTGQIYCGAGTRGSATLVFFVAAVAVTLFVPGIRWIGLRLGIMLYAFASFDAYETAREHNAGIDADASDNPRVAAVLNLTTNGFGYVYAGQKLGIVAVILVSTLARAVAKTLPLLAEVIVAAMAIHVWVIARRRREDAYPSHLRPSPADSRIPRLLPILLSAGILSMYYLLIVVGQIVLLMKR
jgi:TM2 domain-containing membrane protein YozV